MCWERCYPPGWRRRSQHTHVTSLSGHFILLFRLFRTVHSGVSGDFTQQRKKLLNGCFFAFFSRLGLKLPRQAGLCEWQKREDRAKKEFLSLFFRAWITWRMIAGVHVVFSLALPLLIRAKMSEFAGKTPCFFLVFFLRFVKISVSYGLFHCVMWIRH